MVQSTSRRRVARLSFEDGEVVVTPKDRSLFMISAEKAIEACRDAIRRQEGLERFESEFLFPLHDWCLVHQDRVQACYIPMPGNHIQVFIVTFSRQFDFELSEEMAALEMSLAEKGWRVGVTQLPGVEDESLATFFNPEGALGVYAQQRSASAQGGE